MYLYTICNVLTLHLMQRDHIFPVFICSRKVLQKLFHGSDSIRLQQVYIFRCRFQILFQCLHAFIVANPVLRAIENKKMPADKTPALHITLHEYKGLYTHAEVFSKAHLHVLPRKRHSFRISESVQDCCSQVRS